jgi:hypothetical protein
MEGKLMATADQLKYSREYKQHERATNPSFVQKEKLYRKRYAKRLYAFSKIARGFALAHPKELEAWSREQVIRQQYGLRPSPSGLPVASSPAASQRMLPTTPPVLQMHATNGNGSQKAPAGMLAQLGIRLD